MMFFDFPLAVAVTSQTLFKISSKTLVIPQWYIQVNLLGQPY